MYANHDKPLASQLKHSLVNKTTNVPHLEDLATQRVKESMTRLQNVVIAAGQYSNETIDTTGYRSVRIYGTVDHDVSPLLAYTETLETPDSYDSDYVPVQERLAVGVIGTDTYSFDRTFTCPPRFIKIVNPDGQDALTFPNIYIKLQT